MAARATTSAGVLPFRVRDGALEVLVGHMGGPFWARKDAGAWSVLKGEFDPDEETPEQAARREFAEETGVAVPSGALVDLGEVRQSSKRVVGYAIEAPDVDPTTFVPGTFSMEWPPRSGRPQEFPEIDRAEWLAADVAREKLVKAQAAFVDRLEKWLTESREQQG